MTCDKCGLGMANNVRYPAAIINGRIQWFHHECAPLDREPGWTIYQLNGHLHTGAGPS